MARMIMSALFVSCIAVPAVAQTTDAGYADALSTSLASVAKAMHSAIRRNLAEAAEQMPSDEYGFRPTPQVRTFGQLIGHVAIANFFFCSQVRGEKPPIATNYEQVSRPGESHPQPLAEPYVSVSAHTAPSIRPPGRTPSNHQWANSLGSRRATPTSQCVARR